MAGWETLTDKMADKLPSGSITAQSSSEKERLQRQCDGYNKIVGHLTGYDCPECLNRGDFMVVRDLEVMVRLCKCRELREAQRIIERSGLSDVIGKLTFENYQATEWWQKDIKKAAQTYAADPQGKWFFIGGQSGSGKTHICTAIAGELLKRKIPVRYVRWMQTIARINASALDAYERDRILEPIKNVPVLYIDDFLKHRAGDKPTDAEIRTALDLIDYRDYDPELITIISSEWLLSELIDIDEALGGRIKHRSAHEFELPKDQNKNYRLKVKA